MKKLAILLFLVCLTSLCAQTKTNHLTEKQLEEVKTILKDFRKEHAVPGMAISISQNDTIIFSEGFGYANLDTKKEVDPAITQFRVASISKSLTAAALAKLVDDGKLKYDESIYNYVPDFPKKKYDFTIRQVGGHIAGIRHYNGREFINDKKMSIVEGLDIFKDSPLKFEPGSQYSYSTYGWNLLSVVVQNASKTEFNSYMHNQIFEPLKMYSTTLDLSDQPMPNRTHFYRKTNSGEIVEGPHVSNEFKVAGGGFVSTSEDLILFGNEIISPQILSPSSVKELVTPLVLSNGEATNYGIGIGVGQSIRNTPKYSHSGGGIGTTSLLLMYPEEQIVISILTNRSQLPIRDLGDALEKSILN